MTIRRAKEILDSFNENEQDYEIEFCFNPSSNTCVDYSVMDDGGCPMRFDRKSGKWVVVFYVFEKQK